MFRMLLGGFGEGGPMGVRAWAKAMRVQVRLPKPNIPKAMVIATGERANWQVVMGKDKGTRFLDKKTHSFCCEAR